MSPLIRLALTINFISTSHTFTSLFNLLTFPHTLLKWTSHFIFLHFSHPLSCTLFRDNSATCTSISREDCAVCLCRMEEREEEIVTLRCEHAFHRGCFDTWVAFNSAATTTCPLCRDSVSPKRKIVGECQPRILPFHSSCSINNHESEIKWLR
ncbi:unnamed protein product [Sphenostylis stenocarpa]|uniref:RING-type domain-containing protein n=1 Tax=Sphenostylis stenocarpa TaxID=92480 RepID=A0AA86V4V9_9FABA|nr:unnamed protein product [Sphenostylis stenocarpa]